MKDGVTKRAFVIGHPIAHSRSPLIHGWWLRDLGIPGSYERVDVRPDELAAFLSGLGPGGFAGGNVTIPLKEETFRLVSSATERATRLGAVNTLWLEGERLVGDNTDGEGFLGSIDDAIGPGWREQVRTALVIGAGGGARAIVGALLDAGVQRVLVSNRTDERATSLVSFDPRRVQAVPWRDRDEPSPEVDLLVNTTQCGMAGQPLLVIDTSRLPSHAIVADIVYVPLDTPLLAQARRRGLRTVGGLGMLLHQAVPGFERWFGTRPSVTPALRAILEADVRGSP